jgi:hypothetical protein
VVVGLAVVVGVMVVVVVVMVVGEVVEVEVVMVRVDYRVSKERIVKGLGLRLIGVVYKG